VTQTTRTYAQQLQLLTTTTTTTVTVIITTITTTTITTAVAVDQWTIGSVRGWDTTTSAMRHRRLYNLFTETTTTTDNNYYYNYNYDWQKTTVDHVSEADVPQLAPRDRHTPTYSQQLQLSTTTTITRTTSTTKTTTTTNDKPLLPLTSGLSAASDAEVLRLAWDSDLHTTTTTNNYYY